MNPATPQRDMIRSNAHRNAAVVSLINKMYALSQTGALDMDEEVLIIETLALEKGVTWADKDALRKEAKRDMETTEFKNYCEDLDRYEDQRARFEDQANVTGLSFDKFAELCEECFNFSKIQF